MADIELKDAFPQQDQNNETGSEGIRNLLVALLTNEGTNKIRPGRGVDGDSDDLVNTLYGLLVDARLRGYDGTAWDRIRAIAGALQTVATGQNESLVNSKATWANSDSADTEKNVDITIPSTLQKDACYLILIHNPSTVTDLSVVAKTEWTDSDAGTQYAGIHAFSVPSQQTKGVVLDGWVLADGGRLTLSNDTVLGGSDGFSAYVQVRAI